MNTYSCGNGHIDLADRLGIATAASLAVPGSCNSRIIRTTLKDSYSTNDKTLYVIGLSFLARGEIPIGNDRDSLEGRWLSTLHFQFPKNKVMPYFTESEVERFVELKIKTEMYSVEDLLEQLMYQLLSMINDLLHRGHQVLVFRNPEDTYNHCLDHTEFTQLKKCVNIIDGLAWSAILWQIEQGIKFVPGDVKHPPGIRHPMPREHNPLNNFLSEYIKEHALYLPVL
jgi:hypothetical protein